MKQKIKLLTLQLLSFITSIAPLMIVLILNFKTYTKTPSDTLKLCVGGGMVMLFVMLKVMGKLKMPPRVILFGIVFFMSYLLKALMTDLILISGMALMGEVVDTVFFQGGIRRLKQNILIDKTATATTAKVEAVLQKYVTNGRV